MTALGHREPSDGVREAEYEREGHGAQDRGTQSNVTAFTHRVSPLRRSNEAGAPKTIGWLSVPLTAERATHLAAFERRTGRQMIDVLLDFMDDEIFSTREGG